MPARKPNGLTAAERSASNLALGHKMSPEERRRINTRAVELYWKADKLSPDERKVLADELTRVRELPRAEQAQAFQAKVASVALRAVALADLMPAKDLMEQAGSLEKWAKMGSAALGLDADKRGGTTVNVGLLGVSGVVPASVSDKPTIAIETICHTSAV